MTNEGMPLGRNHLQLRPPTVELHQVLELRRIPQLCNEGPHCSDETQGLLKKYLSLVALCEIPPPHIAQYPFEIVSQRGVSHPFALFS